MAPAKFQIHVDETMSQPQQPIQQIQPEARPPQPKMDIERNQRLSFNDYELYPGEFSFEELYARKWIARQEKRKHREEVQMWRKRCEEAEREIHLLRQKLETVNENHMPVVPSSRLSIMPQSLQPAQGNLEYADMSVREGPTDMIFYADSMAADRPTSTIDKFTVPIDQSQYIRQNCATSTPTSKDDKNARRMSRPSISGSPTLKLSPITETSRDCNSKSSSSSSGMGSTPGTVRKPLVMEPLLIEDNKPLNPNNPCTYKRLLKKLAEPLSRRKGYTKIDSPMPRVEQGKAFDTEQGTVLVDQQMADSNIFQGQILPENPQDPSARIVSFRLDSPANDWMFYICTELHRRCQKTEPDIELSIINPDAAYMYTDGSILMFEHFRFVSLQNQLDICRTKRKSLPKSYSAYLALEMIQLVRGLHKCEIIHMNMSPSNIIITARVTRDDISIVDKRTSIIKLIGFDHALDMRLLPQDFKFDVALDHLRTCEMADSRPWSYEVDWFCVLNCIHEMFFMEPMEPTKENGRWSINKQFNEFPTDCWASLFDQLLNIQDIQQCMREVDSAVDKLTTWFKANITFVMKESVTLSMLLRTAS